jgi:hypothetical protein
MITEYKIASTLLQPFADHARVWIYQSSCALTDDEVKQAEIAGNNFVLEWNAHGAALQAGFLVLYNRFVVLVADESAVKASGCSIDSSVRLIRSLEQQLNIELLDRMNLAYRDESGSINTLHMTHFREAISSGEITPETIVFNNLLETAGAMKTAWEVPAKESWHRQLF